MQESFVLTSDNLLLFGLKLQLFPNWDKESFSSAEKISAKVLAENSPGKKVAFF